MEPIERPSLVDRTAAALLTELRSGRWKGFLPGVRVLCAALKVSPPTLLAATGRLVDQGVLVSRGARRKLEIVVPGRKAPAARTAGGASTLKTRRILCLTHDPLECLTHARLEMLTQLSMRKHWDVRHRVIPFEEARAPHRQWDHLLQAESPDHLVVFKGTPVVAAWACARGIPAVFIGGYQGEHPVPVVGLALRPIMRDSVEMLLRLGHQDICMPLLGLFPEMQEKLRDDFRKIMVAAGHPFDPAWHTPASPQRNADVVWNTLTAVFARRVPTAILCQQSDEPAVIQSFLVRHQLRIPEDISIIGLSGGPLCDWFRPRLTHFIGNPAGMIRRVQAWIDRGFPGTAVTEAVTPRMVPGGSVGPPRQEDPPSPRRT